MAFSLSEKCIQTERLNITGNIMTWDGTMIQLSNVSYITTKKLQPAKFPWFVLVCWLVGLALLGTYPMLGIIAIILGGVIFYLWIKENQNRGQSTILTIRTNSGDDLLFLFSDKFFLNKVLTVLEKIIIDGGIGSQNISIDLHGSQISGDARVLNNLGIK